MYNINLTLFLCVKMLSMEWFTSTQRGTDNTQSVSHNYSLQKTHLLIFFLSFVSFQIMVYTRSLCSSSSFSSPGGTVTWGCRHTGPWSEHALSLHLTATRLLFYPPPITCTPSTIRLRSTPRASRRGSSKTSSWARSKQRYAQKCLVWSIWFFVIKCMWTLWIEFLFKLRSQLMLAMMQPHRFHQRTWTWRRLVLVLVLGRGPFAVRNTARFARTATARDAAPPAPILFTTRSPPPRLGRAWSSPRSLSVRYRTSVSR